jgi:Domain of Unknown Function (DUF748)
MKLHDEGPAPRSGMRFRHPWLVGIVALLVVLAVAAQVLIARIDEPLRRYLEKKVNASLVGYTVAVGGLDLHLLGLAVELKDVTVVQNARPRPPMVFLPSWRTSVEWQSLLSFALVADTVLRQPRLFIMLDQTEQEAEDSVHLANRGWQDAVQAVYPLKVNTLRVIDGDVSYYDVGNVPPLELQHVYFRASNIRNVRSVLGQFPSPVELSCSVLGGQLTANGNVDFFAKPNPAISTDFDLRDANLVPIAPMARRYDLIISKGTVAVAGKLVSEPKETRINVSRVEVTNPAIEYARDPRPSERPVERAVVTATKAATTTPGVHVEMQDVRIKGGTFGLKVDALRSEDGSTVYALAKDLPPLRLNDLDMHATNISSDRRPPSSPTRFDVQARVLESGRFHASGTIDPLAEPRPTLAADLELREVSLAPFAPLARHWAFELSGGVLESDGHLDITPDQEALVIHHVTATGPSVSYVKKTTEDDQRLQHVTRAATVPQAKPSYRLDVEEARIREGSFTLIDETTKPSYHLGLTDADVTIKGYSNQESKRRGSASLRGLFMDSGNAAIDATFDSASQTADFNMYVRLEDAKLVDMNDVLRAKGGFDVVGGLFSFYSEIAVKNGHVDGYVKPFFRDLDVYARSQDAKKPIGQQAYEMMVGVAGSVLENRSLDQVATRADLSGPVEGPDAPTWQIVIGLLKNAFWRALLPGLDARDRR